MESEKIINQFKSILGMETKAPEKELEVIEEEVVLAEDAPKESVKEAPKAEEAPAAEAMPVMAYVTEEQLSKEVSSLRAMIEQALEAINQANANAMPKGLSKEDVELAKEEEVKEFVHDPEAVVEKKSQILHSQSRRMTTEDRVMQKLFGN
jgi:hypothetical protein